MWSLIFAVAALLCFLLALFGADVDIDFVVLGFVFIAAYLVVGTTPVASRINR